MCDGGVNMPFLLNPHLRLSHHPIARALDPRTKPSSWPQIYLFALPYRCCTLITFCFLAQHPCLLHPSGPRQKPPTILTPLLLGPLEHNCYRLAGHISRNSSQIPSTSWPQGLGVSSCCFWPPLPLCFFSSHKDKDGFPSTRPS